jgi:hypothetical protein
MIRPRPTAHISAEPFGFFTPTSRYDFNPRPDAWCPHCGAKLSRSRPLGSIACAPCEARILRAIPADQLHPELPAANQRWRRHDRNRKTIDCPGCGGPMHYTATQCRACRYPGQR